MQMPFGKYKDWPVAALPKHYLWWLWCNMDLREPLRSEVRQVLKTGTDAMRDKAASIIFSGHRALAKKYHPDHGGNHEDMLALNEAKSWLLAKIHT